MSSVFPDMVAKNLWKLETPRLTARPESPQPISSLMMPPRSAGCDRVGRRVGRVELVDAELAVLLEDLPERGVGGDDVGGVGELVEALPDRAHHLGGEAVHRVADLDVLVAEAGVVVQQSHGRVPLLVVALVGYSSSDSSWEADAAAAASIRVFLATVAGIARISRGSRVP